MSRFAWRCCTARGRISRLGPERSGRAMKPIRYGVAGHRSFARYRRRRRCLSRRGKVAAVGRDVGTPDGARCSTVRQDRHSRTDRPPRALREPGQEELETVATGAMGRRRGGFTAVCAMPNNDPGYRQPGRHRLHREPGPAGRQGASLPHRAISLGQKGSSGRFGELVGAGR